MSGITMTGIGGVMDALDYDGFGTAEYRVGTNVEYAVYVEFGTSSQEAQPYLRPAVEQAVAELDSIADNADSVDELVEILALKIESYAKERAPVDTGTLRNSITATQLS